jgi:hypothetical protein
MTMEASMVPSETLNQLAFERRVRHLWRLGPRAMAELLSEMATISARRTWLDGRLQAYGRIEPDILDAANAREFAPRMFSLDGGRRP